MENKKTSIIASTTLLSALDFSLPHELLTQTHSIFPIQTQKIK